MTVIWNIWIMPPCLLQFTFPLSSSPHPIFTSPHNLLTTQSTSHHCCHLVTYITTSPYHPHRLLTSSLHHPIALSLYHPHLVLNLALISLISVYPWVFPFLNTVFIPLLYHLYSSFRPRPRSRPLVSPFCTYLHMLPHLDHVLPVFFSHHRHPSPGSLISPYLCFPLLSLHRLVRALALVT